MSIVTSVLTGGSNSHQTSATELNALATDFFGVGVIGGISNTSGVAPSTGAYAVNAQGSPNMTVAVSAGVGYVTATPTGGTSQLIRVSNSATVTATIASNASGSTKYDWIYIKIDPDKLVNPAVDASDVGSIVVSRSSSNTVDNGTPPTYGYNLAIVTVSNGAVSIINGNIADSRLQAGSTFVSTSSAPTRAIKPNTISYSPTTGSNFTTTSASFTDVTGVSTTYASGPTNERLYLWVEAKVSLNTAANAVVTLNAGSDLTPGITTNSTSYGRQGRFYIVDVLANTTTTLKLRAKTDANTLTVYKDTTDDVPTINGFAVSNV